MGEPHQPEHAQRTRDPHNSQHSKKARVETEAFQRHFNDGKRHQASVEEVPPPFGTNTEATLKEKESQGKFGNENHVEDEVDAQRPLGPLDVDEVFEDLLFVRFDGGQHRQVTRDADENRVQHNENGDHCLKAMTLHEGVSSLHVETPLLQQGVMLRRYGNPIPDDGGNRTFVLHLPGRIGVGALDTFRPLGEAVVAFAETVTVRSTCSGERPEERVQGLLDRLHRKA
mmetsp:Transcript_11562/g.32179  ORF Transcript_11562/g.32179 Transcript_11562/m.32179 type:complete len:228 (+) Transcript_11562:90-773(+)